MNKVPLQKPWFYESTCTVFESVDEEQIAVQMVALANGGDRLASDWLKRLVVAPKSTALLDAVCEASSDVHLVLIPQVVNRRPKWRYVYESDKTAGVTKEGLYALAMFRLIKAGLAQRIRRCKLNDCRKLFYGDPRSKWCSTTCGSKSRVRKKRKLDRQRGIAQ